MIKRIQPPELVNPPLDSMLTVQDMYDLGLMHKDRMIEAATKAAEKFEKVRPKMDMMRDIMGL